MHRNIRWKRIANNEDGISLVEILIAVTIMALISVTLMGQFTSAMDKSAEESRRIIAANLARLKAAELRNLFKAQDQFEVLKTKVSSAPHYYKYPGGTDPVSDLIGNKLISTDINGTTYQYRVEFDNTSDGNRKQDMDSQLTNTEEFLARMLVTVYWAGDATSESLPPRTSTTLDTYIVKGW